MVGSSTSWTVRSTDLVARLSSSRRSALSSSKRLNASRRRVGVAGPSPRSRAIEIALEMFCVSANAWRSASISVSSNWRWPPWVRRGVGYPKRRSHERSVLGLTPSMAAAAFVRTTLMPELSSVGQTCASRARRPANRKIPHGLCPAAQRAEKCLELLAVVTPLPARRAIAGQHARVRPAAHRAQRDAEDACRLRDGQAKSGLLGRLVLHDQCFRPLRRDLESLRRLCTALREDAHMGRLGDIDLSLTLDADEQDRLLAKRGDQLAHHRLRCAGLIGDKSLGGPVCVLFEGWDASGKGGAIKRL